MAVLNVICVPDESLRQVSEDINEVTDEMRLLADDMVDTMYAYKGIGLAAPQIGKHIRLFVMDYEQNEEKKGKVYKVFNPKVTKTSEELVEMEEGCLSLPDVTVNIARPREITLEYLDENGHKQIVEAEGLMAICIQHELDHLNGKTLVDYMGPVKRKMAMKKLEKMRRQCEA